MREEFSTLQRYMRFSIRSREYGSSVLSMNYQIMMVNGAVPGSQATLPGYCTQRRQIIMA